MDATDEPSVTCHQVADEAAIEEEGQVIGYFELDPSKLQLVEGENTFYLLPDALGEHVLMTEDGKEGQQIVLVVEEEGSEGAVVQALDACALLGNQATITVDQLQSALSGSVSLQEQLAGITAIPAGDEQVLILSEDPGDKEGPGNKDMAVPPEQYDNASDALQGELQPGLDKLPESTGDLNKTLEALGRGGNVLGNSPGLEVCPNLLLQQEQERPQEQEQERPQEQTVTTGHHENEALITMTEHVPGVGVAVPTASERYDKLSCADSVVRGDRSCHEAVAQINKLPGVEDPKKLEKKPVNRGVNIIDMQIDCDTQSSSICKVPEANLDRHNSNVNELFNEEKENQKKRSMGVNELFNKQLDHNRDTLSQSVSKESLDYSILPRNSELDIDKVSQKRTSGEMSAMRRRGKSEESRISEAAQTGQAIPLETHADFGQSSHDGMTSSSAVIRNREQTQVASASDVYASFLEKSPVKESKVGSSMKEVGSSMKEVSLEEEESHLMLSDLEHNEEEEGKIGECGITDVEDKLTLNEDESVVKETVADTTEHGALQPRLCAHVEATYENIGGQLQDKLSRSPNSTENQDQGNCEDRYTSSADHYKCLEDVTRESTKADFSDNELQKQDKDKSKGDALSTDSSVVLELGTSRSKKHDSSREPSALVQSNEKLLAALDLMPCQEGSNLPTNGVAKPPPTSKPRDIFPEIKPKRKRANLCPDEASSLGKKRWSLRTPTKPRKRVIIPDSDDDDFDVYESNDIPDDTQKNNSNEVFDTLLSDFKIVQAQQGAAEAASTKKKNAKKSSKGAAPQKKMHGKSLEASSSKEMWSPKGVPSSKEIVSSKDVPAPPKEMRSSRKVPSLKQMRSPKEVLASKKMRSPKEAPASKELRSLKEAPASKEALSPKQQRVKSLENVSKKGSDLNRQENACMAPSSSPTKQARKQRPEPTESRFPKKDLLAESCKRIPSLSDSVAGDIRIRCQKSMCSSDRGVLRYHCSKCGFRSARMENIIRHHKQDCPFTRSLHNWYPEPCNQANVPDKSPQNPT